MATAMTKVGKVGAIIRRGAGTISSETMRILVENDIKVQQIVGEIDKRADVFRELEKHTRTEFIALENAKAELAEGEAELAGRLAAVEDENAAAAEKHSADVEALSRRTREVMDREAAADGRANALDDREATIGRGWAEFTTLVERLKTLSLEALED